MVVTTIHNLLSKIKYCSQNTNHNTNYQNIIIKIQRKSQLADVSDPPVSPMSHVL